MGICLPGAASTWCPQSNIDAGTEHITYCRNWCRQWTGCTSTSWWVFECCARIGPKLTPSATGTEAPQRSTPLITALESGSLPIEGSTSAHPPVPVKPKHLRRREVVEASLPKEEDSMLKLKSPLLENTRKASVSALSLVIHNPWACRMSDCKLSALLTVTFNSIWTN
jgi:hypothetical protein